MKGFDFCRKSEKTVKTSFSLIFFEFFFRKKNQQKRKKRYQPFFEFMSFSLSSSSSSVGREQKQENGSNNWKAKEEKKGDKQERVLVVEIPEELFFQVKYLPSNSSGAVKTIFETLQNWFREIKLIPAIESEEDSGHCDSEEEQERENFEYTQEGEDVISEEIRGCDSQESGPARLQK